MHPARSLYIPIYDVSRRCSNCSIAKLCLPAGMPREEIRELDSHIQERLRLHKGETLYLQGDALDYVYAIRSGMIKTHTNLEDGRTQVTGFHMQGEVLGIDSLEDQKHSTDATALEDVEVCVIHVQRLAALLTQAPRLQLQLLRLTSREVRNMQAQLLALGSMNAEERLATFLLSFSERLLARGYSPVEFHLRMTREEIGSYLGLKLETISRLFSRMADSGLIQVRHRHVKLMSVAALRAVAGLSPDSDNEVRKSALKIPAHSHP